MYTSIAPKGHPSNRTQLHNLKVRTHTDRARPYFVKYIQFTRAWKQVTHILIFPTSSLSEYHYPLFI